MDPKKQTQTTKRNKDQTDHCTDQWSTVQTTPTSAPSCRLLVRGVVRLVRGRPVFRSQPLQLTCTYLLTQDFTFDFHFLWLA